MALQEFDLTGITFAHEGAYRVETIVAAFMHRPVQAAEHDVLCGHARTHAAHRNPPLLVIGETIIDHPAYVVEDRRYLTAASKALLSLLLVGMRVSSTFRFKRGTVCLFFAPRLH